MNLDHLQNRSHERLETIMKESQSSETVLADFFLHSSDVGVMRNGGRNGARFAPEAVINVLKKMAWHGPWNQKCNLHFFHQQVLEKENFAIAQEKESQTLGPLLKNSPKAIQIGGGHDHIYPFLKAISTVHKKIICLNIDAHCDTRTDLEMHSGTPFRQFASLETGSFELWQIGIHSFANTESTLSELKSTKLHMNPAPLSPSFFLELEKALASLDSDTAIVFSLDVDALESGIMEGVSAVNHQGLTMAEVQKILNLVLAETKSKKYFGFYEYNPLYDNLSQKGARSLASLIYKILA